MTINFTLTELETRVLCALEHTPKEWGMSKGIGAMLDRNHKSVQRTLRNLVRNGVLVKESRGIYRLKEETK